MKSIILFALLVLMSCDQDPNGNRDSVAKKITVNEVENLTVDILNLNELALKHIQADDEERLFISVVENHHDYEKIHRRAYVDMKHFIGSPDYYIDYGQSVNLNDILISRDRNVHDGKVDYTFDYLYDSESMFGSYPSTFDFNSKHFITNSKYANQSSSKRINNFNTRIDVEKRVKFNNVVYEKSISTDEDFEIELNRSINTTDNAFGFIYQAANGEEVTLTMKVSAETKSFKIPADMLKNFKDKVGLSQFECYIWVAESKRLITTISTVSKSTFKQHETPIFVNFIQSKKVLF